MPGNPKYINKSVNFIWNYNLLNLLSRIVDNFIESLRIKSVCLCVAMLRTYYIFLHSKIGTSKKTCIIVEN